MQMRSSRLDANHHWARNFFANCASTLVVALMFAVFYQIGLVVACLAGVLVLGLAVGLGCAVWFGGGARDRRDDDRKP